MKNIKNTGLLSVRLTGKLLATPSLIWISNSGTMFWVSVPTVLFALDIGVVIVEAVRIGIGIVTGASLVE